MELTLEQIQNFKGKYPKQLWSLFYGRNVGKDFVSTE